MSYLGPDKEGTEEALDELGGDAFISSSALTFLILPKQNATLWALFLLASAPVANFFPPRDFPS